MKKIEIEEVSEEQLAELAGTPLPGERAPEAPEAQDLEAQVLVAGEEQAPEPVPPAEDPSPEDLEAQELEAAIQADEQARLIPDELPDPDPPRDTRQWSLHLLWDDVLLQQVEAPKTLTPDSNLVPAEAFADQLKPKEGFVLLTGPGHRLPDGGVRPLSVKVGDRVHFGVHAVQEVEIEGQSLLVIKEDAILAYWRPVEEADPTTASTSPDPNSTAGDPGLL